jgi:hypothetical protein
MSKPYVVIHTHISVDGKIHTVDIPAFETASQQYQELALYPDKQIYDIDGYLNGRTTSDDNQTHLPHPRGQRGSRGPGRGLHRRIGHKDVLRLHRPLRKTGLGAQCCRLRRTTGISSAAAASRT